jgi:hypothetical protein
MLLNMLGWMLAGGRIKPSASLEVVVGRYELCEDMACMLTEHAQTMLSSSNLTEEDVLLRCHEWLMAGAPVFTAQESEWVIRRLAELLAWTPLELGDAASPYSGRTA